MANYRFAMSIGPADRAESVNFDSDKLNAMSKAKRAAYLNSELIEWANEYMALYYEYEDEDEDEDADDEEENT